MLANKKGLLKAALWTLLGCTFGAALAGYYMYGQWQAEKVAADKEYKEYLKAIRKYDRGFYAKLPIYSDWATPQREKDLRRFLLNDHLKVVGDAGAQPVHKQAEIKLLAEEGRLSEIPNSDDSGHYFFNVPAKYRYLAPFTAKGLDVVTERFRANLKARGVYDQVKLAVSSALRPVTYQKKLQGSNANASFVSSHSYGMSFDLFYDDFYVYLPPPPENSPAAPAIAAARKDMGFLIGRARRRQLHAILADTLLQLQHEGVLYAIWERNQRCYHVTILPK